ncbi:beta-ketoacyl reductase [Dactylosporangium sp. NPDC005572]|uniref:beta-ketoacyl reductase n=1 Tax=Dactylosporangium sp. NPDC005572 TaxID=3156889 RepID=UPI0033A0FDB5
MVHAAVDYVHAVAGAGLDHSAVERAAAAKIVGIENVVEALPLAATARVILCSSVAATFAGPGLAVYAATNRMLDAIAARLRADGIDGRSVQWGVWHSTARPRGEYDDIVAGSERAGILPMPPAAALAAGLTAESQNSLTLSADWTVIAAVCELNGMPALMQDFGGQTGAAVRSVPADASPERVRSIVARVMGLGVDDVLDPDTPLVALGMDSIQALELYRSIQQTLRLEIPVARVLGGATLHDVLEMAGKAPATVGTRLGE